ncbi:MAG: hypothetical protein L3K06_03800, partial [Thermoplasmata archaeon]|nr:hypothetical protein [Thermoplasmata archaeon]
MSGVDPPGSVREARPPPHRAGVAWALAFGGISVAELVALFLGFQGHVPAVVPAHFALSGHIDGWLTSGDILVASLVQVGSITAVVAGVLAFSGRSVPLWRHHRHSIVRPLLWIQASIVLVSEPATYGIVLANGAGSGPPAAWLLPSLLVLGAVPVAAALGV